MTDVDGTLDGGIVQVRRVKKAYEQVSDQLRSLIMSGELTPGQRLPNEAALAAQFGVSRSTVREALRELSAVSLVRTTKGASGGTFVTLPSADHISQFLSANIELLGQSDMVSIEEFLEARKLLEVSAATMAARRRSEEDLERLRAAIPDGPLEREEQFIYNKDFHAHIVNAAGNTLLWICAQPVFSTLQSNLKRSPLPRSFHDKVNEDHRELLAGIEAQDEDAVAEMMAKHLDFLSKTYRKTWRQNSKRDH
jgi:DNA-binding FadR family transcriptional regulator